MQISLKMPIIHSFTESQENIMTYDETGRSLQFENEHVKVWKTIIHPNEPLSMHRHDKARVVVGLKGGKLRKVEHTGETSPLIFEEGKAYWLDADPKGTFHGDVNETNAPIEVMVVEIK